MSCNEQGSCLSLFTAVKNLWLVGFPAAPALFPVGIFPHVSLSLYAWEGRLVRSSSVRCLQTMICEEMHWYWYKHNQHLQNVHVTHLTNLKPLEVIWASSPSLCFLFLSSIRVNPSCSIHFLFPGLEPEPVPDVIGRKQGDTLHKLPVHPKTTEAAHPSQLSQNKSNIYTI